MTLTVAGLVVAVVAAVLAAAGIAAGAVWFLSGRIDSSRAEVLTQVQTQIRQLDAKNEAAHAGIEARADRHEAKLDAIAHDVAFLAGRQAERDRRDGGGS